MRDIGGHSSDPVSSCFFWPLHHVRIKFKIILHACVTSHTNFIVHATYMGTSYICKVMMLLLFLVCLFVVDVCYVVLVWSSCWRLCLPWRLITLGRFPITTHQYWSTWRNYCVVLCAHLVGIMLSQWFQDVLVCCCCCCFWFLFVYGVCVVFTCVCVDTISGVDRKIWMKLRKRYNSEYSICVQMLTVAFHLFG